MLLLCHYDDLPDAQLLYDKLQDMKRTWLAETKDFFLERIDAYPEDPQSLPKKIFAEAYSADDPPITMAMAGINRVAECIPLRSNSKLLKGKGVGKDHRDCQRVFAACKVDADEPKHAVVREPAPSGAQLVKADDNDEDVLRLKYELKLAKLRASKGIAMAEPAKAEAQALDSAIESHPQNGTLALQRNNDGSLRLSPRATVAARDKLVPVKAENDVPDSDTREALDSKLQNNGGATKLEPGAENPITVADLDPYAQSAISALTARKAKGRKRQCEAPKLDLPPKKERCGGKAKKEGGVATNAKKVSGKAKRDPDIKIVKPSQIMAAMPKSENHRKNNPPPVFHKQGVIYTSVKSKRFQALPDRSGASSKRMASWGGSKARRMLGPHV